MQGIAILDPTFGVLHSELRATWRMRVVLFGIILMMAGLFVAAGISSGERALAFGAGLAGLGFVALLQFFVSGIRVRVYEHGIEYQSRFGLKRIAWRDLGSYQLQIIDSAVVGGAAGGLIGALVATAIDRALKREVVPNAVIFKGRDGTKIALAGNIAGYRDLIKTLLPTVTERLFAAAKRDYDSGAELQFGKKLALQHGVGITFTGLFGKKYVLPLERAASATLERAALVIRRNDTNAAWQTVPASYVLNLGVFQKFVETAGKPYEEKLPLAWTS